MANIGDIIQTPEMGYKRFQCINSNISYIGTFTYEDNLKYTDKLNDQIVFYFYGTKLLILDNKTSNRSNNIEINIDGVIDTYNNRGTTSGNYNTCVYMKDGLERKIHKVIITNNSTDTKKRMGLQNIDIDEDGYMVYCDDNGKLYYDMTPIMTSNNTGDYVVNASSYESNKYLPYTCFDNSTSTSWCTPAYKSLGWISIGNINEKFRIDTIGIYAPYNYTSVDGLTQAFRKFKVEGSNDNSSWEVIKEFSTGDYVKDIAKLFDLENVKKYNYFRLHEENTENRKYICASEIKLLLDVNAPFYLIQDNSTNKIYNYDEENNQLVEVTDTSILKENALNNTCIYDLNKIIPLLNNLSDDLTLLCNNNNSVNIQGIKSNKELIVGKQSFSTSIASNIDYFKLDDEANNIKIAFSIDDGLTWKTYSKDTGEFADLSITIPNKSYNEFDEIDLANWNNAKDIIHSNGIEASSLSMIDFNILDMKQIRFAYILSASNSDEMSKMKKLIWQFDSHGCIELCSNSDVNIQISNSGIQLKSNIDADMLKINIGCQSFGDNQDTPVENDCLFEVTESEMDNIINSGWGE